jgi:hypothetical protein
MKLMAAFKMLDLDSHDVNHLLEMHITTLDQFIQTAKDHAEWRKDPKHSEPCWDCRHIAKKLGLPV